MGGGVLVPLPYVCLKWILLALQDTWLKIPRKIYYMNTLVGPNGERGGTGSSNFVSQDDYLMNARTRDGSFFLHDFLSNVYITLFRSITMFCETDNILSFMLNEKNIMYNTLSHV